MCIYCSFCWYLICNAPICSSKHRFCSCFSVSCLFFLICLQQTSYKENDIFLWKYLTCHSLCFCLFFFYVLINLFSFPGPFSALKWYKAMKACVYYVKLYWRSTPNTSNFAFCYFLLFVLRPDTPSYRLFAA